MMLTKKFFLYFRKTQPFPYLSFHNELAFQKLPAGIELEKWKKKESLNQKLDCRLSEYINNNFLWEKVAEQTADVYTKILSN